MDTYFRAPQILPYNRDKALAYAHQWAMSRNPKYFDFNNYGGDCTNFTSQVIYSGSGVMNYSPHAGWYYSSSYKRSPSWADVDLLCKFLVNNKGIGPWGEQVEVKDAKPGDIVQLSFVGGKDFNHSMVIIQTGSTPDINNILIATHTYDRDNYPLNSYTWKDIRFIRILGARK